MKYQYDFIFSFAGEDREIVEQVRNFLKEDGINVFYDLDEQHDLLGKDLAEYFSKLYQESAKFCVIFISNAYLKKPWCHWERRAALSRALKSRNEYIIPYYLEDCTLSSIPDTIGKADLKTTSPRKFAILLKRKYFKSVDTSKLVPNIGINTPLLEKITSSTNINYSYKPNRIERPIKTGFFELDYKLGHSLRAGCFYIVGARPAIGKTTFAINVVSYNIKYEIPTLYVSLELSPQQFIIRLLAMRAGVSLMKLRRDVINEKEKQRITDVSTRLMKEPLFILDLGYEPFFDQFICELYRAAKNLKPRLIIIDYIQMLGGYNFFGMTRNVGLKTIMEGLKWLASQTNSSLLLLSQLTREVEKRRDRIPKINDLRGGKSLASYAHASFLLYREDVYKLDYRSNKYSELQVFIVRSNGKHLKPISLFMRKEDLRILNKNEYLTRNDSDEEFIY